MHFPRGDVLPVIGVLGHFHPLFIKLKVSHLKRKAEFIYLISGVVNIEFAANLISRRRKHSRKAVPEGAAPCVSDVHGACGICRNKFHVDHFPATEIGAAVAFTLFVYIKENVGVKFIGN